MAVIQPGNSSPYEKGNQDRSTEAAGGSLSDNLVIPAAYEGKES